ncbi:hypothetical protein ACGFZL_31990 [Streptomyces sp. NPDC048182]|uniref:hypothetical protein n=1 Tax=Streptomyces sp. NPDC048182 TaxID=3365507 RepID=UPI00370FE8AE
MRTSLRAVLLSCVAAFLAVGGAASPSQAATNPNPIYWSVYTTFIGPGGEDVPLRKGQKDAGGVDGFGKLHIESGHDGQISTWTDMKLEIDRTLDSGKCSTASGKTTCDLLSHTLHYSHAGGMVAVFTGRVDSRSHDGRPVGIITAYYYGCGC